MTIRPVTSPVAATTTAIARRRVDAERQEKWRQLAYSLLQSIWCYLPVSEVAKLIYVAKHYGWLAPDFLSNRLGFNAPHPATTSACDNEKICWNIRNLTIQVDCANVIYLKAIYKIKNIFPDADVNSASINLIGALQRIETLCSRYNLPAYLNNIPNCDTLLNRFIAHASGGLCTVEGEMVRFFYEGHKINCATIYLVFVRGTSFVLKVLLDYIPKDIRDKSWINIFNFVPELLADKWCKGMLEKMEKILICLENGAPLPSDLLLRISQGCKEIKPYFFNVMRVFDYCIGQGHHLSAETLLNFQTNFILFQRDWEKIQTVFAAQEGVIESSFILNLLQKEENLSNLFKLLECLPFESSEACIEAICSIEESTRWVDILIERRGKPLDVFVVRFCFQKKHLIRKTWGDLRTLALPEDRSEREQLTKLFFEYQRYYSGEDDPDRECFITLAELAAWLKI